MKHNFFKFLLAGIVLLGTSINLWADCGTYGCYFCYSVDNGTAQCGDVSTDTYALGKISNNVKITSVYLKVYDGGNGSQYLDGCQFGYKIDNGTDQYIGKNVSFSKTGKTGNNYELQASSFNQVIINATDPSGNHTMKFWWEGINKKDNYRTYLNNDGSNYTMTYTIAPPAVSNFSVSATSGNLSGSGTAGSPYLVKHGTALSLSASSDKAHEDANSHRNYKFGNGNYSTTNTYTSGNLTTSGTIEVKARCINTYDNTLQGAESSKTIYYQAVYTDLSVAANPMGSATDLSISATSTSSSVDVNAGTAATGYHFVNWTSSNGSFGSTTSASTTFTPTANNAVATANYSNQTTVTFDSKDGSAVSGVTATYGSAMPSITPPTKSSYDFKGFYDTDGSSTGVWGKQYYNENGTSANNWDKAVAATTLYAKWELSAVYNLEVEAGYGIKSVTGEQNNITLGQKYDISATPKDGYDFNQWAKIDGLGDVTFDNYQSASTKVTATNGSIKVQATGKTITYTLTYDGLEGTTQSNPTTYTVETETFALTNPTTRVGYNFTGWTCGGNAITQIVKGSFGNKTITATWTPRSDTKYTVKHYWQNVENDEYTLHETENLEGTTATNVTPATKNYEGFTAPSTQTATILADGSLVVTYNYTRNKHTLTWEANGGELSGTYTSGTVKYGATITAPTASKFGKLFNAWSAGVPATMPDNDVTLTANYVDAYFFIEGRFHVANAERTPHGAVWTNTFTNEGWTDESRTIPMVWNEGQSRYEVRTYATPKELSTDLGTQQEKTPWFYIKASESETAWIGAKAYYAATDEVRQLTTANIKAAVGTESGYFYFNSEDNTQWAILCYDAQGVYFVLENIPTYYSINVKVADDDEDKGTVKPTVMNEINTLAYGTAKAESKDPQLYSFEKWGWTSSTQETESFDFAGEITLHDSCQNTWPEIRVNAAGTDLMLIAHFKAREIVTIYFVDSENWGTNIRMHLWGGFEQGTTWPGIKPNETDLTCNGHKVYSYTFDKGAYEKVKWSNNGNDKSSNFIIDPELPYYNERDGRWYDALSSIGPDKTICSQWRVVFNNSDEYFKLVQGQTNIYECFLANVPAWEKEGDNWVKMKYKFGGDWEWRGFTGISNNQKVESYINATYTASTNNSDQDQLNLAGIAEGQTQDFVLTFNTSNLQLTISEPTPKVEIGVKDQAGTAITEYDIDSEEGFLLNAYPQNVDKGTECTYSFQYQKDGGSWTPITAATTKSSTIMGSQLAGPGVYKFKVTMTTGEQPYTSQETENVTIYKYYWLALKEKDNGANWCKNIHLWGGTGIGTTYPGETLTIKEGDWHFYKYKFPTYKMLKWNDGVKDNGSASGDITFDPNKLCYKITGSTDKLWWVEQKDNCANCEDCPNRIYRDFPTNEYWISLDGTLTLTPTIRYYGSNTLNYSWSITSGNNKVDLSSTNTKQTIVTPVAVGDAVVKFVVSDESGESHEYNITLHIINGTTIRVWKRYDDWTPVIHTWGTNDPGTDYEMKSEGNGWYSHTSSLNPVNFMVKKSNNTSNKNEMTLNVNNVTESGCWKVSQYTWNDGDDNGKHLIDKTEDCGLYYRVEETLADGKTTYHSNKVKKANEAVSFYAAQDGTLALQHYDEAQGKYVDVKTLSNPTESNVQQATFTGNDITGMTKYTGDYYIRTDGAKGGWNDYKQAGNKFTSFTRNPLFGNEKYNYYWVTTLKNGENAKAEVGNEINKCLAQTIDDYSCDKNVAANVRFGYCPETNYFTRAIIAGSSVADYLTLYGDNSTYFNGGEDNSTLYTDVQLTHKIYDGSQLKFKDLSDWVYEAEVYAAVDVTRPSDTKAVIKSHYKTLTDYLLGYDSENNRPSYAYTVLGNTSTKNKTFKITVTYDYKTNRLTTAWKPLTGEIDCHLSVDAAIMFVNPVDKDDDVQQITVKDKDSDISSLNNIVYVMEFEENVEHPTRETNHWISLPFDCRISDIYGIEGYVTLNNDKMPTDGVWGIQRYDGEARATKGRMTQSDTYWTWMSRDEELKAGEGYVLSFDRGAIDWPEIEGTRIKRLYFQSKTAGFTLNLSEKEATQEVAEHVENVSLHRYGEDANWNLIGPLAYNNITIDHLSDDAAAPKFLYEYLGKNTTYIEGIGKYRLVNPLDNKGGDTQFKFHSFHSYMVQFAGDINWAQYTQTRQDNPATAPLMATADAEFTYTQMRLNLTKENQLMDKTYVCLSAMGTTGYDLNDDLSKITEAKANQLGSSVDGRIYAANTLPLETEMVALYVNIASAGEYTIALSQENPYLQVSLIDAQTGMTTVLENASYTVTLNKGEYKDRFYLQLKQKSGETPTSFEGKIEQFNLPTDKTQKLLINGNIYLINGGRVYNATGAELK